MESINKITGARFKKCRLYAGISQVDASIILDLTRSTIANIESGKSGLTIENIMKASKAFKVSPIDFLPTISEVDVNIYPIEKAMSIRDQRKIEHLTEKLNQLKEKVNYGKDFNAYCVNCASEPCRCHKQPMTI
jgi:transcriptional regulator with XRE-family HTH domain